MEYLTSMSTDDFLMEAKAKELAAQNDYYKPMAEMKYRGNMNTTTVRTTRGKTIMIQHDVKYPHPYDRLHVLTGTKDHAGNIRSRVRLRSDMIIYLQRNWRNWKFSIRLKLSNTFLKLPKLLVDTEGWILLWIGV